MGIPEKSFFIGLLERDLGLIYGRFRADCYKNYVAVSMNRGVLFVGVLVVRALLLGVYG